MRDSPPPSPKRKVAISSARRNSYTRSLQAQETGIQLDSIVTEQQRQGRQIEDMLSDNVEMKSQLIKLNIETLQIQFNDQIRQIKKVRAKQFKLTASWLGL